MGSNSNSFCLLSHRSRFESWHSVMIVAQLVEQCKTEPSNQNLPSSVGRALAF